MAGIDFNRMSLLEAQVLADGLESQKQAASEMKRQTAKALTVIGLIFLVDAATGINAVTHHDLRSAIASALLGTGLGVITYLRARIPRDQLADIAEKKDILQKYVLPAMALRRDIILEQKKPNNPHLN